MPGVEDSGLKERSPPSASAVSGQAFGG